MQVQVLPCAPLLKPLGSPDFTGVSEFQLLCELGQDRGAVLSREILLDKVWGLGYFGDMRLVDVHVRRLRIKIEDDPSNPKHLVTVRGLGYRLQ